MFIGVAYTPMGNIGGYLRKVGWLIVNKALIPHKQWFLYDVFCLS